MAKRRELSTQLRSQRGSVTVEAAVGIMLISVTCIMCVQLLLIGVQQVRLSVVAAESARIAAASGDLATRLGQAERFVSQEFAGSQVHITSDGSQVEVDLRFKTRVFLLPFAPVLQARSQSPLLDALAVM